MTNKKRLRHIGDNKYIFSTVILTIIIVFLICGCNKNTNDDLHLYDWGETAKEYAIQLFDAHMKDDGFTDYTIDKSFYGFNLSNESESSYIVVFNYICDGTITEYGYNISVDRFGNCTLLDEGTDVVDLLFDSNEK